MDWHTTTVRGEQLAPLLDRIQRAGGTVACSMPSSDGVRVTWINAPLSADVPAPVAASR